MALTLAEKNALDAAFNRLLQIAGLPNGLPFNLSDALFDGPEAQAGDGLVSVDSVLSIGAPPDGSLTIADDYVMLSTTIDGARTFSDGILTDTVGAATASSLSLFGAPVDASNAIGSLLGSSVSLTLAGSKLVSIQNDGDEVAYFDKDGGVHASALVDDGVAQQTTAVMDIYVTSAGNDSTGDGSVGAPFLTIQKAVNMIPKRVRHLVTVRVGAGNFAGFSVQGFNVDGAVAGDPAGLFFLGTYSAFTVATGSNTGTFTSSTAGTVSPPIFTVLTHAGQTWTVDNLLGKFVHITAGTGVGTILPILSNTATTITIPATDATAANDSDYAIIDCGTVITSSVRTVAAIPTSTAQAATTGLLAGTHLIDNMGPTDVCGYRIEGFKYTIGTASSTWNINSQATPNITVSRCVLNSMSVGANIIGVNVRGPGNAEISQCVSIAAGFSIASNIVIGTSGNAVISQCLISNPFNGTNGIATQSSVGCNMTIELCKIFTVNGFGVQIGTTAHLSHTYITATQISNTNDCIRIRESQAVYGPSSLVLYGVDCTTSSSRGLLVQGQHSVNIVGLFGSGHVGSALYISDGAKVQIDSTSTITGTTVDLIIDAVNTSLATMRAATPKALVNANYGTRIYE